MREARAAAALNHPHICTVFEVGEESDQAFIAMELVEGQASTRSFRLAVFLSCRCCGCRAQIADAVAHAHERGILHRDLKTANVMVTPAGRSKVLDFGLAKHLEAAAAVDIAGPRQLAHAGGRGHGNPVVHGARSVARSARRGAQRRWALRIILYELASGQRPFPGQTAFEVSAAILNEPPTALPGSVPQNVRMVIERCLAKSPGERYPHAGELRAALEAIQAGAETPAPRPRTAARPHWSGARLAIVGIASVVLLALFAFDAWGLRRRLLSSGTRVEAVAVLPFEVSPDRTVPTTDTSLTGFRRRSAPSWRGCRDHACHRPGMDAPCGRPGETIPEIARALGASTVVTGAVKSVGNRLEISARVIDAGSEKELWGDTLESDESGLPVVQRDIVRSIASALGFEIASEHQARLASAADIDARTYEATSVGCRFSIKAHRRTASRVLGICGKRRIGIRETRTRGRVWRSATSPSGTGQLRPPMSGRMHARPRSGRSSWTPTWRRPTWHWPASRCPGTSTGREPRSSSGVPTSSTRALPRTGITMRGTS